MVQNKMVFRGNNWRSKIFTIRFVLVLFLTNNNKDLLWFRDKIQWILNGKN